jgi:hypothetical protein
MSDVLTRIYNAVDPLIKAIPEFKQALAASENP